MSNEFSGLRQRQVATRPSQMHKDMRVNINVKVRGLGSSLQQAFLRRNDIVQMRTIDIFFSATLPMEESMTATSAVEAARCLPAFLPPLPVRDGGVGLRDGGVGLL